MEDEEVDGGGEEGEVGMGVEEEEDEEGDLDGLLRSNFWKI